MKTVYWLGIEVYDTIQVFVVYHCSTPESIVIPHGREHWDMPV